MRLRAGYNNTRTKIVGAVATPPQLAGFESVLFDRIERRRIECGQPKDSLRARRRLAPQPLGRRTSTSRATASSAASRCIPADDQVYGAKWLTDARGVVPRRPGYTLGVGAQNLFDVFPDRNTTVNSFNGIQTFPSHSPFGMNGRTIYGRVAWKMGR